MLLFHFVIFFWDLYGLPETPLMNCNGMLCWAELQSSNIHMASQDIYLNYGTRVLCCDGQI